jgi:CheY-like chemotaxis protein
MRKASSRCHDEAHNTLSKDRTPASARREYHDFSYTLLDVGSSDYESAGRLVVSLILIAGKDWRARALIRAQLLEEGFEVEALETVSEALAVLESGIGLPDLFLADISESDDPAADVEALAAWARKVPIWIIASRSFITEKGLRGHGFEMTFLRPVDVGELIDQIKQRLERQA